MRAVTPWVLHGTRWARMGAAAVLVGAAVLAWPVAQGYRDGAAGAPLPPEGGDGWSAMRRAGHAFALERAE